MTSRRSIGSFAPLFAVPLLLAAAALAPSRPALGAERHAVFVEALRDRLYFDTALDFLDDLEARPNLDPTTKSLIVYERAVTLQEAAQHSRDPDERVRQLERAETLLGEFTANNPNDDRLADANSRRAKILLDQAESEVYRAESPSNAEQAPSLRERARSYVDKARKVFMAARDQHQKRYDSFPKFSEDEDVLEQRTEAEYQMIQARLDLGMCTYWEAQTYPEGDANRARLFSEAADEFRAIQDDHRRQHAGLHAQIWEAKCYEEQGELDRAIPLYRRLADPPDGEDPRSVSPGLQEIRDQALRFMLGCWNAKNEFQLVYKRANAKDGWLKTAGRRVNGAQGLGIRWELAIAEEQLAQQSRKEAKQFEDQAAALEKKSENKSLPAAERSAATTEARDTRKAAEQRRDQATELLESALASAREIAQYTTHYQDVAVLMANRIEVELEGRTSDPTIFKPALTQLQLRIAEIQDAAAAVNAADKATKADRQKELDDLLRSTERLAKLTIELARTAEDPDSIDPHDVDQAWFRYAFIEYYLGHEYEAAVIGRHLAKTATDPQSAREGAFIALAAMQAAYHAIDPKVQSRDAEFRMLTEIADEMVRRWPEDRKTDDARLLVADEYAGRQDPVEAAKWFEGVSKNSPGYVDARLKAGQAFYSAYQRGRAADGPEAPSQEQLDAWRRTGVEYLRFGVQKKEEETTANAADDQLFELIRGKISLAEILIDEGDEQAAVDMLTNDPHAPLKAIAVPEETRRPENGLKSVAFAQGIYTLLLQAYIGLEETDKALQAMDQLERVSGGASVELYRGLGQNLQARLVQMRAEGNSERLDEIRAAFDKFLAKIYERKDELGFNSLIWIGQTYFDLGIGMAGDPAAGEYFDKAADAYALVLTKTAADLNGFVPINERNRAAAEEAGSSFDEAEDRKRTVTGVRLQLVRARGAQGSYEVAYDLAKQVLADGPTAMDAQFETALVLKSWAESGPTDAIAKFETAMLGDKAAKLDDGRTVPVYGFKQIAANYAGALSSGQLTNKTGIERLADSYYHLVEAQRGLAAAEANDAKRKAALQRAMTLFAGIRNLGGALDETQKDRFETLYTVVQDDLGVVAQPLEWPRNYEPTPPPKPVVATPRPKVVATAAPPADEGGPSTLIALLLVLVAIGGAVGFYFVMAKPKRRSPAVAGGGDAAEPDFTNFQPTVATTRPNRKPTSKPAPAAALSTGKEGRSKPAAPRPAAKRPAPEISPKKKRPKPPE